MHPVQKLEAAGFTLQLIGCGDLLVTPKSRLSDGARQHIKSHKAVMVEYLRRREALSAPRDGNMGGVFFAASKDCAPLFVPYQPLTDPPIAPTPDTATPIVDWHQADKRYQSHHWGCPICIASGKGHGGQMCDEGARLHAAYEAAPMPEFGKGKR